MLDELKKSIDKGLDYAFATKEKLTKAAQELARENKLTKEDAKKLYDHLLKRSEEARQTLESDLNDLVQATLKKMKVPTAEEVKKLEERIRKLESAAKKPARKAAKPKPAPAKKPARK